MSGISDMAFNHDPTSGMHIDVKVGEAIRMKDSDGREIKVTLIRKSGQQVRMAILAPSELKILRPTDRVD